MTDTRAPFEPSAVVRPVERAPVDRARKPVVSRAWPILAAWCAALVLDGGVFTAAVVLRPRDHLHGPAEPRNHRGRFRYSVARAGESRLKHSARHLPSDIGKWPDRSGRPAAPPSTPVELGEPTRVVHSVAAGETLSTIARGYHGSEGGWTAIAEANVIEAPYVLQIGQGLRLPNVSEARTEAHIRLSPPRESGADARTRGLAAFPANPPPDDAFQPAEPGLVLEAAVAETFGWVVVVEGMCLYILVAVLSALWATATLKREANVRVMWRALLGAIGVGSGVAAALIGVTSLAGGILAYAAASQCAYAVFAGVACGLASYHGAMHVGGRSPTAAAVARAYAYASGVTVVVVLYLTVAFGAFQRSAAMIRLPL